MIEGLRLFPWKHEQVRRDPNWPQRTCSDCMRTQPPDQRQLAACGLLPPPAENLRPFVEAWHGLGYKGPKPTVCPGFTTSLPEVVEAARAKLHWEKGGPACIGVTDWQDDPLGVAIEILAASAGEHQEWRMIPKKDGGGGA